MSVRPSSDRATEHYSHSVGNWGSPQYSTGCRAREGGGKGEAGEREGGREGGRRETALRRGWHQVHVPGWEQFLSQVEYLVRSI